MNFINFIILNSELLYIFFLCLGLPEAAVDSEEDDESCPSYDSFHELKDSVRECLEKEPFERTADDICTLLVKFFKLSPRIAHMA